MIFKSNSLLFFALFAFFAIFASRICIAQPGHFVIPSSDVGTSIAMTGKWLFTPANDKREYAVPVPQMLSRIQWWLDDSEDFKKWEQARLDALGFDTEKNDDGWYRATIEIAGGKLPPGRHLWIEFDGVAMRSKTFINGKQLGSHAGMFSRFSYDLTPHLRAGKNELKVWAGMEKLPETSDQLGEAVTVNIAAGKIISMSKGMFGPLTVAKSNREYDLYGIWQPVKLVVRGPARIQDVFFRSSHRFQDSQVEVEVESRPGVELNVTAKFTEVGKPPGTGGLPMGLRSTGHDRVVLAPLHGEGVDVKTWTPANPNLYRLDVTVESREGTLLDHWADCVGFRTFEIKGNQFYLNGHRYWLRGANQLPYGKNPWDPNLARKLIQLAHDGNQRFTRTHCTPWNEAWLDAADEIGLAVSIEGPRPWAFAGRAEEGAPPLLPSQEIYQHWLMENENIIKRCRNHPSVFMWTVGNEMNLRDGGNIEKWKLLSGVVKNTRRIDPTRPVISTSSYYREHKQYEEDFKPAGIDDGDVDDVHYYNGWYGNSNFTRDAKFATEMKDNRKQRPLISQEVSTGYPDLDTGLPVLRYTRDLLTPQAWVGNVAYPGNDPAIWLDHHAKVTKRWAEQLRYERGDNTAGFCLFSAECWYSHSFEPEGARPYPVYDAIKQAYAPVGVALETTQRRFYAGDEVKTNVYATNDDEQYRWFDRLSLHVDFSPVGGRGSEGQGNIGYAQEPSESAYPRKLNYYDTARIPVRFTIPSRVTERLAMEMTIRLLSGDTEISRTTERIEIFPRVGATQPATPKDLIVIKHGEPLVGLLKGGNVYEKIAAGATAIVLSPTNEDIAYLFPNELFNDDVERERATRAATTRATTRRAALATRPGYKPPASKKATTVAMAPSTKATTRASTQPTPGREQYVEFADIATAAGTKLTENLQPMDLKWWARENDWRAACGTTSVRLRPGGKARELIRYIPPHGYIPEEKRAEQYRAVLSEIPIGKGRLWICNLDIDASASVDPAARIFADNLYRAAADPDSTKVLPEIASHEELLRGVK